MSENCNEEPVARWLETVAELATRRGFAVERWGSTGELSLLGFARAGAAGAPRIYVSAGIHGDEPAGPLAMERLLDEDFFDPSVHWTLCPLLNPRGYAAGTRETPEGIDLNRDYKRFRSAEAAAHAKWLKSRPANDLYLSLHEDWETEGFYLYEIDATGRVRFGERILERVGPVIPTETRSDLDDHRADPPGIIRHPNRPDVPEHWPEAIYHYELYPHLSYTFETPSARPLELRIRAHTEAVKAAVSHFVEEWQSKERSGDHRANRSA